MKFSSNSDGQENTGFVPEKRLLAAVLQRAITDFFSGEGDVKETARSWLLDENQEDAPVSFEFICEALDLDCASLRKAIRAQAEGNISSAAIAIQ